MAAVTDHSSDGSTSPLPTSMNIDICDPKILAISINCYSLLQHCFLVYLKCYAAVTYVANDVKSSRQLNFQFGLVET